MWYVIKSTNCYQQSDYRHIYCYWNHPCVFGPINDFIQEITEKLSAIIKIFDELGVQPLHPLRSGTPVTELKDAMFLLDVLVVALMLAMAILIYLANIFSQVSFHTNPTFRF